MLQPTFPATALTLSEAQLITWRGALAGGMDCPCCTRFAKVYKRKVTWRLAECLVALYRDAMTYGTHHWVHIGDRFRELNIGINQDGALLRHWDLTEARGDQKDDGNPNSGFYRITGFGAAFVEGTVTMPKYAVLYNNTLLDLEGKPVDILDCLGTHFDYDELMRR